MPCLRLHVPTLVPGDAASALERRLSGERGIYGVFAHAHERYIEIDFEDDEITVTRIVELIAEAGHRARLAG